MATTMATTVAAGDKFPALGSQFPVPFTVTYVNPVFPRITIREVIADVVFERVVKLSVFLHARRVRAGK